METSRKRRKSYVVEDEEDEDFGDDASSEQELKVDEQEEDQNEDVDGSENDEKNVEDDDETVKDGEPASETKELSDSQESVHDEQGEDADGTEENGLEDGNEVDVQPSSEEGPVTSSPQSQDQAVDEAAIKVALRKRANELKSRAETLTLTIVRQILAKDLGLEPDGLDAHKKFIRGLVDELLEEAEEEPVVKEKKSAKKDITAAKEKKSANTDTMAAKEKKSAKKDIMAAEDKKSMKKDIMTKHDDQPSKPKSSSTGKRRVEAQKKKEVEEQSQENDSASENSSQEEKPARERKKQKRDTEGKPKSVPVKKSVDDKRPFSAKVERLRDILKNVGIGVSPAIYKKAKLAPEDEREELLVRELQQRLIQEGLSADPSEKEIRRVKAKLQKAKDLDGIDNSNIVVEPRRRAAATDWFAPRPNKYLQVNKADKASEEEDSDDEPKPVVTGAMDD